MPLPAKDEEVYKTVRMLIAAPCKNADCVLQDKNWGLVQQVIARAPRWLIKKLTLTYLTLGLSDIASQIGVQSEDEVRALVLDMVRVALLRCVTWCG